MLIKLRSNLMYDPALPPRPPVASAPQGMFTRNLIGSLAASASKLADPHDKIGIWFVLQDMSIRTEGNFRYIYRSPIPLASLTHTVSASLSPTSAAPPRPPTATPRTRCLSSTLARHPSLHCAIAMCLPCTRPRSSRAWWRARR